MERKLTVNVVTGQGGGGHYATYYALKAIAEQQNRPWVFQLTDMDDIITRLSNQNQITNAYEMFGISGHDLYNLMLKRDWTWLWPLQMRLNKLLVRLNHSTGVKIFEDYWRQQQPDVVVSVMPLYNKGLWESLQRAKPGTPYITVLTDFADCPPAFWIDLDARNTLVCGTKRAADQARKLGVAEERIVETSGLVIHPDFTEASSLSSENRASERKQIGLDPNTLTGFVMFGGNGSDVMLEIAKRLEDFQDQVQLIFICGRNQHVADVLQNYVGPQKRVVVGFTDSVIEYMRLSDFFVGKPGNISVSEALAMQLPVITTCNALTMAQERYCAQWILENEVGLVISSFREIDRAVKTLMKSNNYERYRSKLKRLKNRAIFEVTHLLQNTLEHSAATHTVSQPAIACSATTQGHDAFNNPLSL